MSAVTWVWLSPSVSWSVGGVPNEFAFISVRYWPIVTATLYYVKRPLNGVQTEESTPVISGQWSSLLQQEVLKPLYKGQACIQQVHAWNFQTKSSTAVNFCSSYFIKADTPVLPEEKGNSPAACPWNVSNYTAILYYGHNEGVLGLVSSLVSLSVSPTVSNQMHLYLWHPLNVRRPHVASTFANNLTSGFSR